MNQHERNLAGFNDYFKRAGSNVDSLNCGDAATHMLAFRKFFKSFINDHNQKYAPNSELFINGEEADKIKEFFAKMEVLLMAKPDGYLHDATQVSRENLKSIHTNSRTALMDALEATSAMQEKLIYLMSTIDRDIGDLVWYVCANSPPVVGA